MSITSELTKSLRRVWKVTGPQDIRYPDGPQEVWLIADEEAARQFDLRLQAHVAAEREAPGTRVHPVIDALVVAYPGIQSAASVAALALALDQLYGEKYADAGAQQSED